MARKKPAARKRAAGMSVVAAVQRDLDVFGAVDPGIAKSGLAATALALARSLNNPSTSASARATCARALVVTLAELRELAQPAELAPALEELTRLRAEVARLSELEKKGDQLDELTAKRADRLAGGSAT